MMRKVTRLLATALAVTALAAAAPPRTPELPKSAPAPSAPAVSPIPTAPGAVSACVHSLDANDLKAWLDGLLPYAMKTGDTLSAGKNAPASLRRSGSVAAKRTPSHSASRLSASKCASTRCHIGSSNRRSAKYLPLKGMTNRSTQTP